MSPAAEVGLPVVPAAPTTRMNLNRDPDQPPPHTVSIHAVGPSSDRPRQQQHPARPHPRVLAVIATGYYRDSAPSRAVQCVTQQRDLAAGVAGPGRVQLWPHIAGANSVLQRQYLCAGSEAGRVGDHVLRRS